MKIEISGIIRFLIVSFFLALILTSITGLLQNTPKASIVGAYYYGYPFYFLIKMPLLNRVDFVLINFLKDFLLFWMVISALIVLKSFWSRSEELLPSWSDYRARFLIIFILSGFFAKMICEFVHEFLGHGSFVLLFGGKITNINISILWPYTFSSIKWAGSFLPWQMIWIQSGGILVTLIVSVILQTLILMRFIERRWLSTFFFWLSFWTFLSSAGYLLLGGISPFGDVEYLISVGVLTRSSSLLIGLGIFLVIFFTLSRIYVRILSKSELVDDNKSICLSLGLFWLLLLPIILLAIAGRNWPLAYSALGVLPAVIILFLYIISPRIFHVFRG